MNKFEITEQRNNIINILNLNSLYPVLTKHGYDFMVLLTHFLKDDVIRYLQHLIEIKRPYIISGREDLFTEICELQEFRDNLDEYRDVYDALSYI